MFQQQKPVPGTIYTHFKEGKKYQIVTVATNTETEEEMVVYQALYGDFRVYVRPLSMFLEKLDKNKYPDAEQLYRFEIEMKGEAGHQKDIKIQESVNSTESVNPQETDNRQEEIHPKFRAFLDAETTNERLAILRDMREILDDTMINSIAVVMDVNVKEGRLDDRYDELLHCIQVKQQYETNRFR